MENKTQISPLGNALFYIPYEKNPYMPEKSEAGFVFNDDVADDPNTGEQGNLEKGIICAKVVAVGPECKSIKEGDDIICRLFQGEPIPFMRKGFFMLPETAVLAVLADDLDTRFKK